MASKITWSPEAVEDLESIAEFVARDSDAYAAALVSRIIRAVERLADFPRLAARSPDFEDDDVRELHVESYRVIYRVRPGVISLGAIIHGARLVKPAIRGRKI